MAEPKYPDVSVTAPPDGDTGVLRSRVHRVLSAEVSTAEADQYLAQTNLYLTYPDELLKLTRAWVTVEGDVDLDEARRAAAQQRIPTDLAPLTQPVGGTTRWQYAVANIGTFNSPERMAGVLAVAGANGWELVAIYDKASNWFQGFEKGFMLLKRPVPEGVTPSSWCLQLRG